MDFSLGTLISPILGNLAGENIIEKLKRKSFKELSDITHKAKVHSPEELQSQFNVNLKVIPGYPNALYVKQKDIPEETRKLYEQKANVLQNLKNPFSKNKAEILRASLEFSKTPGGGIILGESFLNPTVIAHEKGHQMDDSFLSSIAPSVENFWRSYKMPLLGTAAAITIGELFPKYRDVATLTNLGIQGLSTIPLLYSEYKASANAEKIYPKVDKELLNSTFSNYLSGSLGERLGIPALTHLGQYLVKKD